MYETLINDSAFRARSLECARGIAEWLIAHQSPPSDVDALSGSTIFGIDPRGPRHPAFEWNYGLLAMGLSSAAMVFGEEKYRLAADGVMRFLKTLQIFSPFLPEHEGAIREMTPQTPWCYVRDALTAAWGFLEYYRVTEKKEYLQRAVAWGEWCLKHGIDDTPFFKWGVCFEEDTGLHVPEMRPDLHGAFHGGSLNFFPLLARATGEKKWIGEVYRRCTEYYRTTILQPNGFLHTVNADDGCPVEDPQRALHHFNDDLGTLGLLNAGVALNDPKCFEAADRFMAAAFAEQRPDGSFETSCACIPVLLNSAWEGRRYLKFTVSDDALRAAADHFFSRQYPADGDPDFAGAIDEFDEHGCCIRSMGYALIFFLKLAGGDNRFLTIA